MFTFGIFTTHFPYIVFVVFYGYFLIFGFNKASNGEIQIGGNKFKTEFSESKYYADSNTDSDSYSFSDYVDGLYKHAEFEEILFKRKLDHPDFASSEYRQGYYIIDHFCRPPPLS